MTRRTLLPLACTLVLVAAWAGPASAQTSDVWTRVGFVHLDGGVQAETRGFTSRATFNLNGEIGSLDAHYKFATLPVVAARTGFKLWKNIAIGLAVTHYTREGIATVDAWLPHPIRRLQSRHVIGTASGLTREETMVAAELSWVLKLGTKADLMLLVGPANFSTREDLATNVRYTEIYPYDIATFTGVDTKTLRKNAWGVTAGFDLSVMFTPHLGLGSLVRYSWATAPFSPSIGNSTTVTLGGAQGSVGVRIRY